MRNMGLTKNKLLKNLSNFIILCPLVEKSNNFLIFHIFEKKSTQNFLSFFEAPVICRRSGLCLFSSQTKTSGRFYTIFLISMLFRSVPWSNCYGLAVDSCFPALFLLERPQTSF